MAQVYLGVSPVAMNPMIPGYPGVAQAKSMTTVFLIDNGSLRPDSTRNLRRVASALAGKTGTAVEPVSLLHSDRVPPSELDSVPAEVFEPALSGRAARGLTDFLLVPFFFGPSRAITEFIPERVGRVRAKFPELRVRIARPLVDLEGPVDFRVAEILRDRVEACRTPGEKPPVIVVDHGSPVPEVTAVRNFVAGQLSVLLGGRASRVAPASMERRSGDQYRFNEPLLEDLLDRPGFNRGEVVVSLLFLSPGRHAGPEGDVAGICRAAEKRNPGLRAVMTDLAGGHDRVVEILADRVGEARSDEETR